MDREAIIEESKKNIRNEVMKRRVLFITTKNLDYIRNSQEIKIIKNEALSSTIIGFNDKKYIVRLLKVFLKLLLLDVKKIDVVFIGFAPQLILPFWYFKFKNKRIIIDFFISMYDTLVNDRKVFEEKSVVAKMLKSIDSKTLKQADVIISDTKVHGEYFVERLGANPRKMRTLYLEADKTLYYPRRIIKKKELREKFVVLYFGTILPLQGVETVLKTFDLLKNDERFYFYMIGTIGDKYIKPSSENIKYIDWLSQQELAEYIAMADLCLAGHFNKSIDKAQRTIPGKAYIYDAMGKMMVLGENRANRELFETSERVFFVPMGDEHALAELIKEVELFEKRVNSL